MAEQPSMECPFCGARTYHPRDIAEEYCGWCHVFIEDELERRRLAPELAMAAIRELTDE